MKSPERAIAAIVSMSLATMCSPASARDMVIRGVIIDAASRDPLPESDIAVYEWKNFLGLASKKRLIGRVSADVSGRFTVRVDTRGSIELLVAHCKGADLAATYSIYGSAVERDAIDVVVPLHPATPGFVSSISPACAASADRPADPASPHR